MRIGSFWWRLWIRACPYDWRDRWVPGWKELHAFVDEWMAAPGDVMGRAAYVPPVKVEGADDSDEPTAPPGLIEPPELSIDQPMTRQMVAFRHLGGNGIGAMRLRFVLQCIGSFTKAMQLVHRDRALTPDERQRFMTHATPFEKVDWQHIASGTAGLLGALFLMPPHVEE